MKAIHQKIKKYVAFVLLLTGLLSVSSCNDYIEIPPPITDLTADMVFSNAETIEAAQAGLYSYTLLSSVWDYYPEFFGGMLADELYYRLSSYDYLRYNVYNPRSSVIPNFWTYGYRGIYHANSLITALEKTTLLSESVRARYIGEAKFFRAYLHFMLANFFGDVPLILTTDVAVSSTAPRTAKADVFKQVVEDLKAAESSLAGSGNGRTKVTDLAAKAMLSRVYLYQENWADAEAKATELITSGLQLETIDRIFRRSGNEAIFRISSSNSSTTWINRTYIGSLFVPAASTVNYLITKQLYDSFETGDLRKSNWIGARVVSGDSLRFPYKYKLRTDPSDVSLAEEFVILRLGEQYLIRAEARAQQANTSGAISDLNVIRKRAGLADLSSALSGQALLLAIEQERRVELFLEGGHRWFDVIRTGRADAVFGTMKADTWKSYATLLPIAQVEIDKNPSLTQNPGYE